jgi:hypothetical protein
MAHPYEEFEGTALWKAIDAELGDLVANGDLTLTTAREYVVGALCKRLHEVQRISTDPTLPDSESLVAALEAAANGRRSGPLWQQGVATHYADPALEGVRRDASLTALRLERGDIGASQATEYFNLLARRVRDHAS